LEGTEPIAPIVSNHVRRKKCERNSAVEGKRMRILLIGSLSAMLAGCSCLNSPQAMLEGCTSQACFSRTAAAEPVELTPAPFTPNPAPPKAKPKKIAKSTAPSPAKHDNAAEPADEKAISPVIMKPEFPAPRQPAETSDPATKKPKPAIPAKMDVAASGQPAETSDPVLKKAKTTVAAKMEDPGSVEFADMKRAMRKNTFGQPVDTICGHLKAKRAAGEDTGEKPFLYLVKEDEAYVVDNNPGSAAATAYRNICITLDVRGKEIRQQQSRE
jgi:hypothetical protein